MRAWSTHFILPEEPVESGQTGRQPALFVSHFVPNLYPSFGEQRESNSRNRPKSLILLEFIPKGMARVTRAKTNEISQSFQGIKTFSISICSAICLPAVVQTVVHPPFNSTQVSNRSVRAV